MKFCVTKTQNKKNIKRQIKENQIFKQDIVIVKKKCDKCLNNCLNGKKIEEKKKKIMRKKYKTSFC